MPLLPVEPSLFPDHLFTTEANNLSDARWWVLHTKPRAEKALARKCFELDLPFFLPLYDRQWRKNGRSFRSHIPLFPGYLFLHGNADRRTDVLKTNLVANVLPVVDQLRMQDDLSRVHQLVTSGAPLTPESRMVPGTWVEIIAGPLAGLEGRVMRIGKQLKFAVEVQFLQQGVSVEVDSWMIQLVDSQRPAALCGGLAR